MSDLISRKKAFEYFVTLWECIGTIMDRGEWEDVCMTTANEIPSADRPQGEWIVHFDDIWPEESTQECSVCHEHQIINGNDDNYCPNCGARMKGVDDYERAIEQMEHDMLYEPTYNSEDGSM